MKKFTLGFVIGVISFLLSLDVISLVSENAEPGSFLYKARLMTYNPGLGISEPLSGRCTKDIRLSPGGEPQIMRVYFQCNYFQIKLSDVIYGGVSK